MTVGGWQSPGQYKSVEEITKSQTSRQTNTMTRNPVSNDRKLTTGQLRKHKYRELTLSNPQEIEHHPSLYNLLFLCLKAMELNIFRHK